jgi:hypothetical protein
MGVARARFSVELGFDLASGKADASQLEEIADAARGPETSE